MAFVFFSLNEKGGNMAHYLVQASYSSGSWAAQIKNPQNRIEQVGKMFASKGVKFLSGYYSFGEFDLCLILEGPDNVSAGVCTNCYCCRRSNFKNPDHRPHDGRRRP